MIFFFALENDFNKWIIDARYVCTSKPLNHNNFDDFSFNCKKYFHNDMKYKLLIISTQNRSLSVRFGLHLFIST